MRYFTNNPLERLMMQKPKAAREDSPPDAAKEHFCYGCKRFGQSCVALWRVQGFIIGFGFSDYGF